MKIFVVMAALGVLALAVRPDTRHSLPPIVVTGGVLGGSDGGLQVVQKHIYVHVAPQEPEELRPTSPITHAQNEQKTLTNVVSKNPGDAPGTPTTAPTAPRKKREELVRKLRQLPPRRESVNQTQVKHNIVFVKATTDATPVTSAQAQNEQKTLIYVLAKKPEDAPRKKRGLVRKVRQAPRPIAVREEQKKYKIVFVKATPEAIPATSAQAQNEQKTLP